jgi:hypothetical protein
MNIWVRCIVHPSGKIWSRRGSGPLAFSVCHSQRRRQAGEYTSSR